MFMVTANHIEGKSIEMLGLVTGSVVRSKHIGRDLMAGLKGIVGGELVGYSEMMEESRTIAIERMQKEARKLGANAIIGVQFSTSAVMDGAAEVLASGTAVRFL